MLRTLGSHIRNQWAGFLSLFLVLTGGIAYAANTIGSSDIINESILSQDIKNGQVLNPDIANNAVRAGKVFDESLTGHDIQDNTIGGADVNESLLDPMTSAQIQNESLTGHDIQDNTIGGADVNESFLPAASTWSVHDPNDFELNTNYQQVIWTGDNTNGTNGGAYIHLSAPGRVFATASVVVEFASPFGAGVSCQLGVIHDGVRTGLGVPSNESFDGDAGVLTVPLSGGKQVPAGDYAANVTCRGTELGNEYFSRGNLIFWAMPA